MSKKVFIKDGPGPFLRKQDLHAEHPVDVKELLHKPGYEKLPRNPMTHVNLRLSMEICDWIWEQYPNEPTISTAVLRYIKDKYGTRNPNGSV